MSIIVIEGADNIGKTTIAKYLVEQLNYQYYHCSVPISEDSAKNEYFSLIERDNIILDRSWIGEFVYAPLFRNYLPNYRDEIKTRLKEKSILLILLHCNKNKLKDLKYINSNEFLNKHEEISNKFLEEFAKIKYGQKVIFNIENFSSLEEEKLIIKNFVHNWIININTYKDFINNYSLTMFNPSFRFLNGNIDFNKEHKCEFFEDHKNYEFYKNYHSITYGTGNLKSKIMLIGEAPGFKGCGKTGIPFYNDKSGMLLRYCLFKNCISENEYYITNVLKCNPLNNKINLRDLNICGKELLKEIQLINPTKIYSIGATAENFLKKYNISSQRIFHPAYAFYKGSIKEYIENFGKVIQIE